jgi:hypothetical protein
MKATKETIKAFRLGAMLATNYGHTIFQFNPKTKMMENILEKNAKKILEAHK